MNVCAVCDRVLPDDIVGEWREWAMSPICSKDCLVIAVELAQVEFMGTSQALLDFFENRERR